MIGPFGRPGPAATLRQHCPQMTQRRCTEEEGRDGWRLPFRSHSLIILSFGILLKSWVNVLLNRQIGIVSTAADPIRSGRGHRTGYVLARALAG